MIKKILVPIDFSKTSINALKYAFNLSQQLGYGVECFHAYKEGDYVNGEIANKEFFKEKLDISCENSIPREFVNSIIIHPFKGSLSTGLMQLTSQSMPELLVMGTNGVSGIKKFIFGSNSTNIMNLINCTLLIVPKKHKWSDIKHIMWANDFKPNKNKKGLELMVSIAKKHNSEVRIAHVKTTDEDNSKIEQWETKLKSNLFEGVKYSFKKIRRSTVSKGITYYLKFKKDNDLLVLVKRESNLIKTLTRTGHTLKFAYNPQLPIMIIHS